VEREVEQQTRLMDTMVTGAILIMGFIIPVAIMDHPENPLFHHNSLFTDLFLNNSNLLAKWVAVGVVAHVLGSVIAVIAMCLIPRPFEEDSARNDLKDYIKKFIDGGLTGNANSWIYTSGRSVNKDAYEKARKVVEALDPDSIWAWVHYSDSRKDLIDWGRRKLHYSYLAENWMIAIILGVGFGCLVAPAVSYQTLLSWRGIALCMLIIFSICVVFELWDLREKNVKWDNDMVAMYVAARICRDLEERFLPSLTKEKEIQDRPNGMP
jgi:hypothetical protein